MKNLIIIILCLGIFLSFAEAQDRYSETIMRGLSNHGKNKDQQYMTAGDRTYIIGTQDGNFPDLGRHVEGEMGGLWLHPIKLMDGFWVRVTDVSSGKRSWLSDASEFINYPYGNRLKYSSIDGVEVQRFQFCPDRQTGMIIQYIIKNSSATNRSIKLEFSVKTDLSPVWLAEEIGIKDQPDKVVWEPEDNFFSANDTGNSWFTVWGTSNKSSKQSMDADLPEKTIGKGTSASAEYDLSINKDSSATLTFVIAGSAKSKKEAEDSYRFLLKNHEKLLLEKKNYYASIIERARIKIPDQKLQEVYNWVKVNNEWMVRDVPEIGRGLSAGYPEYPWWFGCDNTYSLQGVMAIGDFDLAKQTLYLLKNESMKKNGNGRIIHEVSTNGVVYNPGNTQETAHFIMAVEELFRWTGDIKFLKQMYPVMKMGIQWLLNDMDQNKNLFPEGYGIMEVYGLNAELIDVSVYTQQALKATANAAAILNEPQFQKEYEQTASKLAAKINKDFWDDAEGSYTDFFGTRAQAVSAAEGAITQLKRDKDELEENKPRIVYYEQLKQKFAAMPDESKGRITNKNWVINTPMETGIAPVEKAIPLLDKIRKENVGEYGPYLSATEKNAMMTISTGVQAVAEAQYGRINESLWYVNRIVDTFNRVLPGSISEMMPDYGDFTQAWTIYGIVVPIVQYVFGIQPDAYKKTIVFEPQLPSGWNDITIENLPIGTNVISFSRAKTSKGIEFSLISKDSDWNMILKLKESAGAKYYLNRESVPWNLAGFRMTGKTNTLVISH